MTQDQFLHALRQAPEHQSFSASMAWIEANFDYFPTRFSNGPLVNEPGQNEGSCKLFAMAQLLGLSTEECLQCFGDYYHDDVVKNPGGLDHANIRQFMKTGYGGLRYDKPPLRARNGAPLR